MLWGFFWFFFLRTDLNLSTQRYIGPVRYYPPWEVTKLFPHFRDFLQFWLSSEVTLRHWDWLGDIVKSSAKLGLVREIRYRIENHHFLKKGGW